MEKLLKFSTYFGLIISSLLFIFISYNQELSISYSMALVYILVITIFVFLNAKLVNNEKFYKQTINIYIILYFILFICLTMFIGRTGRGFISIDSFQTYIMSTNFMPFKTISGYAFSDSNTGIVIYNLLGNFLALIPLTVLLLIKDEKYNNLKKQFIILSISVLMVESMQFLFSTGSFDIDDFILNIGGALLAFKIFKNKKILLILKSILLNNLKIKDWIKKAILALFSIILIILNLTIVIEVRDHYEYKKHLYKKTFYVIDKENCSTKTQIEYEKYTIFLNCVEVLYETEDSFQMSLEDAFKNKYLTIESMKEKLNLSPQSKKETFFDKKDDISMIFCNNNIYIGKYKMMSNKNVCE